MTCESMTALSTNGFSNFVAMEPFEYVPDAARVKIVVGVPRRKATVCRCTCCIRDEGRPLGFADQAVIPNHPELLPLRAVVVSV